MPVASKKSPVNYSDRLEKELGGEFENHKADETTYGSGSDLPAGINGGIAQLVEAKIDEYKEGDNKGKLYLYMAGIVKSPHEHNGIVVSGLRTQKTIKLFANNQATKDEALAKALNEVRKMGGTTAEIKARQFPVLLEALKAEAPHFRFRTYEFAPENAKEGDAPFIVHDFRGKCEYNGEAGGNGVVDNTGTPTDAGEGQSQEEDWDAVVAAANNDDADAQQKLQDTCKSMGMTAEAVDNIESWEACAEIIKSGGTPTTESSEGGGSSEAAATTWKPDKGDEYTVKLKGMKSAQKLKVVQVFKETLKLVNESTKNEYTSVPWADNPPRIDGNEI